MRRSTRTGVRSDPVQVDQLHPGPEAGDMLLRVEDVLAMLGVSRSWVYQAALKQESVDPAAGRRPVTRADPVPPFGHPGLAPRARGRRDRRSRAVVVVARGTITPRKRGDGVTVYDVRYDVPSPDGRRRQARKTLATKRAAERFLASQLAAVDRGGIRAESRETLASCLDRWLAEHRTRIEDYTYRAYEVDVRLRLKPALGTVRLRDLTPQHVRRLVSDLSAQGDLRPKTINNAVTVLRVALSTPSRMA